MEDALQYKTQQMLLHAKNFELLFPLNPCPKEYPMLGVT